MSCCCWMSCWYLWDWMSRCVFCDHFLLTDYGNLNCWTSRTVLGGAGFVFGDVVMIDCVHCYCHHRLLRLCHCSDLEAADLDDLDLEHADLEDSDLEHSIL